MNLLATLPGIFPLYIILHGAVFIASTLLCLLPLASLETQDVLGLKIFNGQKVKTDSQVVHCGVEDKGRHLGLYVRASLGRGDRNQYGYIPYKLLSGIYASVYICQARCQCLF